MKKINLLAAMFVCALGASVLYGASLTGSAKSTALGDESADDSSSSSTLAVATSENTDSTSKVAEKAKNKSSEENKATGLATLPNGTAYVGVYTYLNLRDGVWGNITAQMQNNEEVTITDRDGDWYKVTTSHGDGYAHARYIFSGKNQRYSGNDASDPGSSSGSSGSSGNVVLNVSGDSVQGRVVSAAQELVNKYSTSGSFPYAAGTNGGRLGCAQVVSTALKAAGVVPSINLGCYGVMDMLKSAGWTKVSAPPYQAGDVIFWSTYDSNGDGKNDPNTHIGIIMSSGNSVQAMSNSSSQKKPRYHSAEYMPVSTVMRKV